MKQSHNSGEFQQAVKREISGLLHTAVARVEHLNGPWLNLKVVNLSSQKCNYTGIQVCVRFTGVHGSHFACLLQSHTHPLKCMSEMQVSFLNAHSQILVSQNLSLDAQYFLYASKYFPLDLSTVYKVCHVCSPILSCARRWVPVYADKEKRLAVMSIGFLLQSRDDAVVWRGPKKNGEPHT